MSGDLGGVIPMEVDPILLPWSGQNAVDSLDMRMMWIEIAKYVDGESLVKLASTCKWFYKVITEDCVWKYACLRDLDMPDPGNVSFKWIRSPTSKLESGLLLFCTNWLLRNYTYAGTMRVLDTRHFELFLSQGYQNGSWDYRQVGSHEIKGVVDAASGAIIDLEHLKDASTAEMFKTETWFEKDEDLEQTLTTLHAVAFNANNVEEDNDGLQVKFHIFRAGTGTDEPIMAIRISQHLL